MTFDIAKESENFKVTLLKTAISLNQTTNRKKVELLFKNTLEKTIPLEKIKDQFSWDKALLTKDQILDYLLKRLHAENMVLEMLLMKIDSDTFFKKYLEKNIVAKKSKKPMALILDEIIGPTVHETIQERSASGVDRDLYYVRPNIIKERYRELILGSYLRRVERSKNDSDPDLTRLKFFAIPKARRNLGLLSDEEKIIRDKCEESEKRYKRNNS